MLEQLWAGWRLAYVSDAIDAAGAPGAPGVTPVADGSASATGETIFERILGSGLSDEETYVLWRGDRCAALLNIYPYTNGHLMVLPTRAVAELEDLTDDEASELWATVRDGVVALKSAYGCEGVNVGLNLGPAAGAGVPGHLHVHVLPRWRGDTNFMTAVAQTRVLPEALDETWRKLRAAWPA